MVVMPWEFALLLGAVLFAFGLTLAFAIGVIQVNQINQSVNEVAKASGAEIPENDADAVRWARDAADKASEKLVHSFVAMSDDDRVGVNGVKVAYLFDCLRRAYVLMEDAHAVARGAKIVSAADPETRAHTLALIDMVEDKVIVASPEPNLEPDPTRH